MKVWQTDVQIHFYFTSTVFVWIIHVELVNSGGQKTRVGSGTLLLSTGKQTNIKPTCIGKEKRRLWSRGLGCVTAVTVTRQSRNSLQNCAGHIVISFYYLLGNRRRF